MEDFKAQYEAVKAENDNLKQVLEQYQANKQAIEGAIQEFMAANINLKASEILSGNNLAKLKAEIAALKAEIEKSAKAEPVAEPVVDASAEPASEISDAA